MSRILNFQSLQFALILFAVSARSLNRKDRRSTRNRDLASAKVAAEAGQRGKWRYRLGKLSRSLRNNGTSFSDRMQRLSMEASTPGPSKISSLDTPGSDRSTMPDHKGASQQEDGKRRMKRERVLHTPMGHCGKDIPLISQRKQCRWFTTDKGSRKKAYSMAIMATLAYEDFYKRLSLDVSAMHGFQLFRSKRRRAIHLQVKRGIQCWIAQAAHWICNKMAFSKWPHTFQPPANNKTIDNDHILRASPSCPFAPREQEAVDREAYTFHYWLYNWFEPTSIPGVNYHDTDVLVSTSRDGKVLVLAFAGTQSAADHVTNVQTFEPAAHSNMFHGGRNITMEGSLHRGFLNAYARVEKGSVLRLCQNCSIVEESRPISILDRRYKSCYSENPIGRQTRAPPRHAKNTNARSGSTIANTSAPFAANESVTKENEGMQPDDEVLEHKKAGGCRTVNEKLVTILRELVTETLLIGDAVHISGHSQGGSLATLVALDIVINFPAVPISSLHLWTFGAPQVVDNLFLNSAIAAAPRLPYFLKKGGRSRFHRFVTLSDACEVDFVSMVTERALPTHQSNLRGKAARKLGGVRGSIVHLTKPHFLVTPEQYSANFTVKTSNATKTKKTSTRSAIAAHSMINYLQGISRESCDYPLATDLPLEWRVEIGEVQSG